MLWNHGVECFWNPQKITQLRNHASWITKCLNCNLIFKKCKMKNKIWTKDGVKKGMNHWWFGLRLVDFGLGFSALANSPFELFGEELQGVWRPFWVSAEIRAFFLPLVWRVVENKGEGLNAQHFQNPIAAAFGGRKQGGGKDGRGRKKAWNSADF